jgi:hypothetical protein
MAWFSWARLLGWVVVGVGLVGGCAVVGFASLVVAKAIRGGL